MNVSAVVLSPRLRSAPGNVKLLIRSKGTLASRRACVASSVAVMDADSNRAKLVLYLSSPIFNPRSKLTVSETLAKYSHRSFSVPGRQERPSTGLSVGSGTKSGGEYLLNLF